MSGFRAGWRTRCSAHATRAWPPFRAFLARFGHSLSHGTIEELCTILIAATPREYVVKFAAGSSIRTVGDLPLTILNVENMYLVGSDFRHVPPARSTYQREAPSIHAAPILVPVYPAVRRRLEPPDNLPHPPGIGGSNLFPHISQVVPPLPPEVMREIENLVDEFTLS